MFRLNLKASSLANKIFTCQKRSLIDSCQLRPTVRLTQVLHKKLFYSTVSKNNAAPKSPLASLISKDGAKEEPEKPEENDQKENREQSWRRMKYTLMFFGLSFSCVGMYLIIELGSPRKNEMGQLVMDDYSNMNIVKQYVLRTINELNYYRQLIREPSRDKLLPDIIRHPYYSPKYTLVLEFTDVVVHPEWTYNTGWRFKKRPGLDHFLEILSGTYEIVIYTAEQGMTVFPIVEALDPKNHINYKLVRDATLFVDGRHVKDLDKLNRDLSKTIVIDWDGGSTKYHPDNVFQVQRWAGNDDDVTLLHLAAFLMAISQNSIDDVREVIRYYNDFDDPLGTFRERQKKLLELSDSKEEEAPAAPVVKRWTQTFFKKQI